MHQIEIEEFESILDATTKTVTGPINWEPVPGARGALRFSAPIWSERGRPLTVQGWFNPYNLKLEYKIIYSGVGRIYGLDFQNRHTNPDGSVVGSPHKHRWAGSLRDRNAYAPDDISAGPDSPTEVWDQFCREAKLRHAGMVSPVVRDEEALP